ncbi:MAG: DUF58 domain-containing protein [Planctomycetota bacterium]
MSRIELPLPTKPERTWSEWIAWIATEDHCEWANQYVAWFKTPLGVLALGAVSSLLCGLYVAPQGYVLLAAMACVIVVGLVWPLVAIRGVNSQLIFDGRRGREGNASVAKLVVTNRWPWPVWGLTVNDPLSSGNEQAPIALARVQGWSTATFDCSLTPTQRGVYPKQEVSIGTGFPFGLYQASRAASVPRRLIVWPRTFTLPPLGTTASRSHWRGAVTESRAGSEGTRLGVRDHRVGDSLRDVHWAKSARYERLIVSERESMTTEEVTVVVPVEPIPADTPTSPTFEWRVRIAASIAESFVANQGNVDLRLGGTTLIAGQAPGDLQCLLDGLAHFNPSAAGSMPRAAGHAIGEVISVAEEASRIVLRRNGSAAMNASAASKRPGWIEIDSLDEVPTQVQRGWQRRTRRASRAG